MLNQIAASVFEAWQAGHGPQQIATPVTTRHARVLNSETEAEPGSFGIWCIGPWDFRLEPLPAPAAPTL